MRDPEHIQKLITAIGQKIFLPTNPAFSSVTFPAIREHPSLVTIGRDASQMHPPRCQNINQSRQQAINPFLVQTSIVKSTDAGTSHWAFSNVCQRFGAFAPELVRYCLV